MSLVYDALKQHREPAISLAAPVGSVLPVTEQPDRTRSFSIGNSAWMVISLLLALIAGGSMYLFASSRQPQAGILNETIPQTNPALPPIASVTAKGDLPAKDAPMPKQTPGLDLPIPVQPAVAASTTSDNTQHRMATPAIAPVPANKSALKLAAQAQMTAQPGGHSSIISGKSIQPSPAVLQVAINSMEPHPKNQPENHLAAPADTLPAQPSPHISSVNPASASSRKSAPPATVASLPEVMPAQPSPTVASSIPMPAPTRKPASPSVESSLSPQDVSLIVSRFNAAVRGSEFDTAKTLLDKVSGELGADSLVTLRLHGFLALKMGNLQQAREDYQRITSSLQNDYEANRNLAVIDLQQGNQELTKQRSKQMLEIYPDDPVFKVLAN